MIPPGRAPTNGLALCAISDARSSERTMIGLRIRGTIVIALALAMCVVHANVPVQAAMKNPRVLVGSGLAGPYVNYPVAIERKFFEKHGLKPELKIFSSGPEAIQAVGAGAVHLSHTGEFTHLTLKSR